MAALRNPAVLKMAQDVLKDPTQMDKYSGDPDVRPRPTRQSSMCAWQGCRALCGTSLPRSLALSLAVSGPHSTRLEIPGTKFAYAATARSTVLSTSERSMLLAPLLVRRVLC
eukprot:3555647-Rhodomonas_salina.3